jgi:uncharacterized protein YndB with AHSA1/START domain
MDDAAPSPTPIESETADLVLDFDLQGSMDQVWNALTDPELLAAWLAPQAVRPALGGPIDCELLESQPPSRLRYAWRGQEGSGLPDSEVCFELAPNTVGGVRLRLTHSGLAPVSAGIGSARVLSLEHFRRPPRPAVMLDRSALKWAA